MSEKILEIKQVDTWSPDGKKYSTYEGFKITTDKQEIILAIADGQGCCEQWGYFMSNDNFEDFVGADLLDIKIVDSCLNVERLKEICEGVTDVMFVNVETSKGLLQFTAYNSHNGYYGHDAIVSSTQLKYETIL